MFFWGDIILESFEFILEFFVDFVVFEWGYEVDYFFEVNGKYFVELGFGYWVCLGMSLWNSFGGCMSNV